MVVPDALVPPAPIGQGIDWQIQGMFLERFHPSTGVLVSDPPPPPTGFPGAPVPEPFARFIEDGLHRVVITAGLPNDGYLVLFDTYHPDWKVEVDVGGARVHRRAKREGGWVGSTAIGCCFSSR